MLLVSYRSSIRQNARPAGFPSVALSKVYPPFNCASAGLYGMAKFHVLFSHLMCRCRCCRYGSAVRRSSDGSELGDCAMVEKHAGMGRLMADPGRQSIAGNRSEMYDGPVAIGEIPALVIGSGLGVLGAIRLLGRAGVTAYVFGPADVESKFRWYRPAPRIDSSVAKPERLAAYLAAAPFERAVLVPASDAAVRAIAALPDALARRFPASVSPAGIAEQLTDKAQFGEMLARLRAPGPRTRRIDRICDLDAAPDEEFEGSFLKPVDSARFMSCFGVKGSLVSSRADAVEKATLALSSGHRMVLQEYIPNTQWPDGSGARADHILIDAFVDRNTRVVAMFARRRLRMFPLDFGNTSYMVSIPLDDVGEAAGALGRIATKLGCRGIVSGEFKRDPRDGVYKLLEINSRVWWFVEYAGRCGVDLCSVSYLDALGADLEPVSSYRVGATFFHAYYDFHALKASRRAGDGGVALRARSWVGAQEPLFNWTDPLPAIHDLSARLRSRIGLASIK